MRRKSKPRTPFTPSLGMVDPAPISVRVAAAVKMTGISRSRLFELIRDGEIDSVKLGTSRLILVHSLQQLLDRLPRER